MTTQSRDGVYPRVLNAEGIAKKAARDHQDEDYRRAQDAAYEMAMEAGYHIEDSEGIALDAGMEHGKLQEREGGSV